MEGNRDALREIRRLIRCRRANPLSRPLATNLVTTLSNESLTGAGLVDGFLTTALRSSLRLYGLCASAAWQPTKDSSRLVTSTVLGFCSGTMEALFFTTYKSKATNFHFG
jgi:hypothetical protein